MDHIEKTNTVIMPGQRKEIIIDDISLAFRYCPSGRFFMGSSDEAIRKEKFINEPQYEAILSEGFWMMETPVTQNLYERIQKDNPSYFKGELNPVENVSWYDATEFCRELSSRSGLNIDLPSEAEWEYACRAGTSTPFAYGKAIDSSMANFNGRFPYGGAKIGLYRLTTLPVRSFKPNNWGLFGMHGNVKEWCLDWYGNYPSGTVRDPLNRNPSPHEIISDEGIMQRSDKVLRGGSWDSLGIFLRSASRDSNAPETRLGTIGFRIIIRL